ncbi:41620_t:CDS:2 [Gigaspora margarita]|uniref:41620_t:CDS:1 n=1 Tax=Gigaspora margarita TaxID=4874 RepID=A0ABN7VCK7_GIGMA|nr:41620_t:CDS:2 [Gigaspora margarita]
MEPYILLACIIILFLCLQNIYVQVKRSAQILIWYSISNFITVISFVLAGIFLPNDFSLSNATTFESIMCGICGILHSTSSISRYGVALALSTELFVSLGLSDPITKRNNVNIRRLNIILTLVIPILSITLSIIMLTLHHNPVFEVVDTGGICSVSRYDDYRLLLFILRTVPQYLPVYPSCILSVFNTYRSRESFALPWQSKLSTKSSPLRSTRAGPPPETTSSSKPVIPPNVLLRMASWCCLLLFSSVPDATIKLIQNIHYVIYNNQIYLINNPFLNRNGVTLQMCFSMILFLLCFGTGEFAAKQYGIFWTKVIGFICCSTSKIQTSEIDTISSRSLDSDLDSSAIPPSFILSPQIARPRFKTTIDKRYLTGARAGWVTCKSLVCQKCHYPTESDSGNKSTDISSPPLVYSNSTPQIDKKYLTGARAGWIARNSTLYQNSQASINSDSENKDIDYKSSSIENHPEISQTVSIGENSCTCIRLDSKLSHTVSITDQILVDNLEETKSNLL